MLINIILGLTLVAINVIIQAYGTSFWLDRLQSLESKLKAENISRPSARILIFTSFFLISIHLIQSGIWAGLYFFSPSVEEFESFEKAIYFSLVTFTTLGYGDITIDTNSRILAGLEAINGILLIGWSTAFMFSVYQALKRKKLN